MACNENVIKNMAGEVSRNCQMKNITVDVEFVVYIIELLLLNPKYGKLFKKTLNRKNLELVVNECVNMLLSGNVRSIYTLKMQFTMYSNYNKPYALQKQYLERIDTCLKPLLNEIMDETADLEEDQAAFRKLYRKISIYIVLYSGLGNPSTITTLKEGMAALESVFTLEDLEGFRHMTRVEKSARLAELATVVSGVRLFNRDCRLTGDGIPDLPKNLVDACKACLNTLQHALTATLHRVNMLTTVISGSVKVDDETGNVIVVPPVPDLTEDYYNTAYFMLSMNVQYEIFLRRLLADIKSVDESANTDVARFEEVLRQLHGATRYKAAVPTLTIFPLFTDLWVVWRSMQCLMYVVSLINLLAQTLASMVEHARLPQNLLDRMMEAGCNKVKETEEQIKSKQADNDKISLTRFPNYQSYSDYTLLDTDKPLYYLGYCAVCASRGALVPSAARAGLVRHRHTKYGFCNRAMALQFANDPQRYINEVLEQARTNLHLINLLNLKDDLIAVREIEPLVVRSIPKTKVSEKDIQTEVHPIESNYDRNYTWDLWEWKRRACQWATIVNCQTHSTQTNYSHIRSEIHCQTFEFRDKTQQTKKDCAINTNRCDYFFWGLRGKVGYGQHLMNLNERVHKYEDCLSRADSVGFFTQTFAKKEKLCCEHKRATENDNEEEEDDEQSKTEGESRDAFYDDDGDDADDDSSEDD